VEAVLEVAKKEYAEKAKVNLPKVIIDGKVYLPPQRSSRDAHGPSWYLLTTLHYIYMLPPLRNLRCARNSDELGHELMLLMMTNKQLRRRGACVPGRQDRLRQHAGREARCLLQAKAS
jgi:hypothetical protein